MRKPHHKHPTSLQAADAQPQNNTKTGVAVVETHLKAKPVAEEDIRVFAYRKWENAGKPTGDGSMFWLEAERELVQMK
jgi:hypothetical protein